MFKFIRMQSFFSQRAEQSALELMSLSDLKETIATHLSGCGPSVPPSHAQFVCRCHRCETITADQPFLFSKAALRILESSTSAEAIDAGIRELGAAGLFPPAVAAEVIRILGKIRVSQLPLQSQSPRHRISTARLIASFLDLVYYPWAPRPACLPCLDLDRPCYVRAAHATRAVQRCWACIVTPSRCIKPSGQCIRAKV